MCSFNRRDTTLACLQRLQASAGLAGLRLTAQLVDDGSQDGTAEAVQQQFRWVRVQRADGSLFWARAMHRAFAQALRESHAHYLWLNDDTLLEPDALARLMASAQACRQAAGGPVIVVGSCVDAQGVPSYGGQQRGRGWRRSRFTLVPPVLQAQAVSTMDGNIVLISAEAAERVGNLDPAFEHAMADYDYGLRAAQAGVQVWLAPGVHGHCSTNASAGSFHDQRLTLQQRWQNLLSRKGLPWRSWRRFTRRHMGLAWPLYFVWPYLRVLLGRAAHGHRR
jgi:GT2 family glycosyltransferase